MRQLPFLNDRLPVGIGSRHLVVDGPLVAALQEEVNRGQRFATHIGVGPCDTLFCKRVEQELSSCCGALEKAAFLAGAVGGDDGAGGGISLRDAFIFAALQGCLTEVFCAHGRACPQMLEGMGELFGHRNPVTWRKMLRGAWAVSEVARRYGDRGDAVYLPRAKEDLRGVDLIVIPAGGQRIEAWVLQVKSQVGKGRKWPPDIYAHAASSTARFDANLRIAAKKTCKVAHCLRGVWGVPTVPVLAVIRRPF